MSELPKDLVEEILCRVPTTSLKRLRSTCKRWNKLFKDDRRFTRKHFEKATKEFMVLMLKECRVCLMSVNLHGSLFVQVTGELSLIDPLSSLDEDQQFDIYQVFHCDGLLLCPDDDNYDDNARIVVWNPCTGQTRWIQTKNHNNTSPFYYALGSYQDNKSNNKSYKVLSYSDNQEFAIYEINSNSWRILDVNHDCLLETDGVSLNGNTYWCASDEKEKHLGIFLVIFDYSTEIFECLPCPFPICDYQTVALSVVREEKLSVLLRRRENTQRTEIWVTNKIDETKAKVVSWSKVFEVDLKPKLDIWYGVNFLFDEEKKVLMCCDKYRSKNMVYIVGEENEVKRVYFRDELDLPYLFNYVPSLTQIQLCVGGKRKRGE